MTRLYSIIFLAFLSIAAALPCRAFYVGGLYYYPTSTGECELRGFAPDRIITEEFDLVIPDVIVDGTKEYKVTRIAHNAFSEQFFLRHVGIGIYVKEIGANAFCLCTNLQEIALPGSVKKIGDRAFLGCASLKSLIGFPESIGTYAFEGCAMLNTVYLGYGLKYIEPGAFKDCVALPWIDIPASVERISAGVAYVVHDGAFENCINLRGVSFSFDVAPASKMMLTRIGANTFKDCISLERFESPESVLFIDSNVFKGCSSLKHLEWGGPNTVRIASQDWTDVPLKKLIFHGNANYSFSAGAATCFNVLPNLVQVRFDTHADKVPSNLFRGCPALKEVHLTSVKEIGGYAFADCRALAELTLSDDLTRMDYNCFENCTSLEGIALPNSLEKVSDKAFKGCTSLKEASIGSSVSSVQGSAFSGCTSLTKLTSHAVTPPRASRFDNDIYEQTTLVVPLGSMEAYKKADAWKRFFQIREEDLSAIDDIREDSAGFNLSLSGRRLSVNSASAVSIHSLDGSLLRRLPGGQVTVELPSGLFIVSSPTHSEKILVK